MDLNLFSAAVIGSKWRQDPDTVGSSTTRHEGIADSIFYYNNDIGAVENWKDNGGATEKKTNLFFVNTVFNRLTGTWETGGENEDTYSHFFNCHEAQGSSTVSGVFTDSTTSSTDFSLLFNDPANGDWSPVDS